jgi:hypothetical protein
VLLRCQKKIPTPWNFEEALGGDKKENFDYSLSCVVCVLDFIGVEKMHKFPRIDRLPPYVFATVDQLKMDARRKGEDIIRFGDG